MRILVFSLVVLIAGWTQSSFAQDAQTVAEALFAKGLAHLQSGRYELACSELEESYRLDSRLGVLFTIATCHAKAGHFATASARYSDYLDIFEKLGPPQQKAQKGREVAAAEAKAELAPKIPELTVVLSASAPSDAVVRRDGVVLTGASLGTSLPVDPGEHVLAVEAKGRVPRSERVTLGEGEKKTITLECGPEKAPETPVSSVPVELPRPAVVSTFPYWALGVSGVGVLVGAGTGAAALVKKGETNENCLGHACNARGKEAADTGQSFATASTIAFGIGAAAAGAAVVYWAIPKRGKAPPATGAVAAMNPWGTPFENGAVFGVRGEIR